MEHDDRDRAVAALRLGLELGMTHIDTAELYGAGRVEELVGEAIAGRRDEVFLVSKVLPQNASRSGAIEACERSLRRLATDRLDCYLLHWPSSYPLEETIAAFEALTAAGKILSYGVSNFDASQLARAVALAGAAKIACNQVLYHLAQRAIEHTVLPACEAERVALVGYIPFGRAAFPPLGRTGALADVARKHAVTERQVALAFLTRKPSLFAIPKSSNPAHVRENAEAMRLVLDEDDFSALANAFPLGNVTTALPRV